MRFLPGDPGPCFFLRPDYELLALRLFSILFVSLLASQFCVLSAIAQLGWPVED